MASGYSSSQRKVIDQLLSAAGAFGASPREEKALLEAGSVESNFMPLVGGDRDSTGVLQQRPSQGWGPVGQSVQTDALQFLRAARAARGLRGSAGALAQAVQRSGFPDRYDQHSEEAVALLGAHGGAHRGSAAGGGATTGGGMTSSGSAEATPASTAGVDALLAAMQQPQQQRTVSGLQAPSFSAAPTLAMGAQVPVASGSGGRAPSGVDSLLAAASAQADTASPAGTTVSGASSSGTSAKGTAASATDRGKVEVAPGANRAGVGLKRPLLSLFDDVSAAARRPVTITTGTNHNRMTTSGNVSDHWDGEAGDSAVGGDARQDPGAAKRGDLLAAHALQVSYARAGKNVPFQSALAQARKGGLWNIETPQGRVQIIWRSLVGGNHYNHVHVGLNPGR